MIDEDKELPTTAAKAEYVKTTRKLIQAKQLIAKRAPLVAAILAAFDPQTKSSMINSMIVDSTGIPYETVQPMTNAMHAVGLLECWHCRSVDEDVPDKQYFPAAWNLGGLTLPAYDASDKGKPSKKPKH